MESGPTYAAVAANISCLLALVKTLNAAENSIVKIMINMIFSISCSGTRNSTAVGTINKTTATTVRIRRARTSTRYLE